MRVGGGGVCRSVHKTHSATHIYSVSFLTKGSFRQNKSNLIKVLLVILFIILGSPPFPNAINGTLAEVGLLLSGIAVHTCAGNNLIKTC